MLHDQEGKTRVGMVGLVAAAFALLFVLLVMGPGNRQHVESNPGPSGTPGSTIVDQKPPPAEGPSGTTTGTAR